MTRDDLTARLRATFLQELQEQLRELNGALLQLEQRPADAELIRTLFRAAHTIKGAARVAGAPNIEAACHSLEAVFAELRDRQRRLTGAEFSLLFAVFDALEQAGRVLRAAPLEPAEGKDADDASDGGALRSLLPRLAELTAAGPPAPAVRAEAVDFPRPPAGRVREAAAAGEPRAASPAEPETGSEPREETRRSEQKYEARSDAADDLVRVSAERLDALIDAVGELLIATGQVLDRSDTDDPASRRLEKASDDIASVARRLRLRPFSDACEALPRAVRDIAAAAGKEVSLELHGEDVEADRMVVDALRDPLLHLVRNAVDHGIETPDEREQRGKPRVGLVAVSAGLAGSRLVVTVSDDGAGIDEGKVRSALELQGRSAPRSRDALADALLSGGFSTRQEASRISGRGVGVDLVRSAIERIGGSLDVEWRDGAGTTFTLECPPTPATIRALLVRLGAYLFAIPTAHVRRLRRLHAGALRTVDGTTVLPTKQGPVPVHSLAALLGAPLEAKPIEEVAPLVVIDAGSRRAGLVVDEVLEEDEIVVRPLQLGDHSVPNAAGAAVLPSGRLALVLAPAALLAGAARLGTAIAPAFAAPRDQPPPRILVADDSITTRTLEQSVLEAAGYAVATAVDGEDAWRQLERDGADLVVADVEMPRMDGFTLCRRIRGSSRLAELPVVLVTGLSSDADRASGLEAGADAYIVKSGFDHASLLETVRQLIGRT